MNVSRHIDTLVRPIDKFGRDARGRPLRAEPNEGSMRMLSIGRQSELAAAISPANMHWLVTPLWASDDVDFHILRTSLLRHAHAAMGVVVGARPGAGAVILLPTDCAFELHAVNSSESGRPFEKLFSQRRMTVCVDHWTEVLAAETRPMQEEGPRHGRR